MKYKLRPSDSSKPQKIVDYLQGGILIRFNETKVQKEENTSYHCTEFWFESTATIQQIEATTKENNFVLTDEHKNLIK